MIVKINRSGFLYFKRSGSFRPIGCVGKWEFCSDRCPHFHTYPETDHRYAKLHLCNGIIYTMDEIIDERVNSDNQDNPNDSIEGDLDNINLKLEKRGN